MKRKTVKLLCFLIPVSGWRRKARGYLVHRYVISDAERETIRKQRELYATVIDSIHPGCVCIDCGANIGQETIPWAQRGAEVHAFEPHPECFRTLKDKTAQYGNVHLYEKGVWHQDARMKLYLREGAGIEDVSESSSLLKSKQNVDENRYVEVEIIDLVEFMRKLGKRVDVLKIDIEGAEVELVQKIIDTGIYEEIGMIVVETHEQIPEIATDIQRLRRLIAERKIPNINLDWR